MVGSCCVRGFWCLRAAVGPPPVAARLSCLSVCLSRGACVRAPSLVCGGFARKVFMITSHVNLEHLECSL